MGKALYRKYRPTKLSDVVGQETVVNALSHAIEKNHLSHAYLFTGPRGTGKTSIARIFAHAVNHFDYQLEDDYVDIIEIDAASNTGVDNIRDLRETAIIAPTEGKYKVYIIDEVHMLSKSAFNALLKILEEPPEHVIFIMATTDPQKIPVTITSRAQNYTFNLASPEVMKNHLSTIAKSEKIKIDQSALDLIVRRGGGSFRDSLSLLDQFATLAAGQEITADTIIQALGLPQDQLIADLLAAYAETDVAKITTLLKDLLNTGARPETIAEAALQQIIEHPDKAHLPLLRSLPAVMPPFPEAKLLLAFLSNDDPGAAPPAPTIALPKPAAAPASPSTPIAPSTSPTAPPPIASPAPPTMPPSPTASPMPSPEAPSPDTAAPSASSTPPLPPAADPWPNILQSLSSRGATLVLYKLLAGAKHQLSGATLHIYAKNKGIIDSPNNKALISRLSGGLTIVTHSLSEYNNSQNLGPISDIIDGVEEVTDNNGNPFI